ncbi:hypothetical protein TL16_g00411 [Triparma laevis f. inornata]|uniref:Uncharacterized protein n=1 Tax=Triparma laevis f. inornata TaxID=1714386 RepID=A0A9W6ZF54_9STRA|nr:hypothetical protein TL16_g00411 [Triparma laevis f. inornata]
MASPGKTDSVARQLRLQKVRESSIGSTALLEKKHRQVYELQGIKTLEKMKIDDKDKLAALKKSRESSSSPAKSTTEQNPATSSSPTSPVSSYLPTIKPDSDDVIGIDKPMEDVIWKQRTQSAKIDNRPASREVLQPELSKYHSRLSKKRREELKDRISDKVNLIGSKIKTSVLEEKKYMDSKQIFHPNANAQRAHSNLLVKLQRTLNPHIMEEIVLKEMIRDDKRNLTSEEIDQLENKFGKMFQGTAFGNILHVHRKDDEIDPETELSTKMKVKPVLGNGPLDTSVTRNSEELKDQGILDYEAFKTMSSRPSTRGALAEDEDEAFSDGFRNFRHIESLASKSKARNNKNQDTEPLAFNNYGIYSGVLTKAEAPDKSGLGESVKNRVWHDSERSGRRANYAERHSPVKGFTSSFDNKNRRFGEGAKSPKREESKSATPTSSSKRSRASQIKRSRRQSTEESGTVMKEAERLQTRLEVAWTKLETPMIKKLQYLEKYAHNNFSAKLPASVQLWEKASLIVPLRERVVKILKEMKAGGRVPPKDIKQNLVGLEASGCQVDPPPIYYFEQRLDTGDVNDEELLTVFETFDDRGNSEKDKYMIDTKAWLTEILRNIDEYVYKLGDDLQDEVGEVVMYKGNPYAIEKL